MMKRICQLLPLLIVLLLAACGGGQEAATEAPTQAAQATPTLVASVPTVAPTLPLPPVVVEETATAGDTPAPAPTEAIAPAPGPWPAGQFGYGVQSHATVGDPNQTMTAISQQLGLDWVKIQLEWPLVEPDPAYYQWFFYDAAISTANANGLHVMLSVVGAPAWTRAAGTENGPPDDYAVYAGFLSQLLARYPGQIQAIEVWNEQNIDREWSTAQGISAAAYVQFLSQAYQTIKAIDPTIIVISGALSPTGVHDGVTSFDDFIYLDEALAGGLLNYADCVGAHHNGYNIGPDVAFDQAGNSPEAATAIFRGPFANPHHSWSFKTTLEVYAQKVQAIDPNKKLCVTEFGWGSSQGYDSFPAGFEFVQDNSLEEQAQFIVQAFQQMHDSGDVWLAFLFNFDFGNKGNGPTDDNVPYSLVDTSGVPRPAFGALAAMAKNP